MRVCLFCAVKLEARLVDVQRLHTDAMKHSLDDFKWTEW